MYVLNQEASFIWKEAEGRNVLYCGETQVGSIMPLEMDGANVRDVVSEVEEGVFRWERFWCFSSPLPRRIKQASMDFRAASPAEYWMIPAVSYNGNDWGRGHEPKGCSKDGEFWVFASHRVAIPGATYSESSAFSVALYGESTDAGPGFSCSIQVYPDGTVHRLQWPEAERPHVYAARDQYEPAFEEEWLITGAGEVRTVAYLIVQPVEQPRFAYRRLLDFAWRQHVHPYKPWHEPEQIWQLGIRFIKESLWVEDRFFRGFTWGLYWDGQRWAQKLDAPYEIGWVGQNASLANSLIRDYLDCGEQSSLDKGLAALDCWAEHAPLDNGLFRVRFDHIVGKKPVDETEVNDACNLGTAALQFFEAASLVEQCGLSRPRYTEIALGICDFAISSQQANGQWGKSWDNQGNCLDPEGTIGAFLVPPLIQAYKQTRQRKYMDAAVKGYAYYAAEFERNGYSTAGALDTYCIDKESSIPLLKGSLLLYEATGQGDYLRLAEKAAQYAATWQWHHSVAFPEGSALHALQYDSFGGTSVSTQHHHIDHYGLTLIPDLNKLADLTGNGQWRQRAEAIWANATAVISDGSLSVWDKLRPPGGQDEGLCQTRWHTSRGHFFGVSQWLVAWPTAFRLELLRDGEIAQKMIE